MDDVVARLRRRHEAELSKVVLDPSVRAICQHSSFIFAYNTLRDVNEGELSAERVREEALEAMDVCHEAGMKGATAGGSKRAGTM